MRAPPTKKTAEATRRNGTKNRRNTSPEIEEKLVPSFTKRPKRATKTEASNTKIIPISSIFKGRVLT
jgi:hypothetical protein